MLSAIITWSLTHRWLVIVLTVGLALTGGVALSRLPMDAFPDTTPVQVQINSVAPALSPLEVERQITAAVEQAIGGVQGLQEVRSLSKFGFSQVTAVFEDGTNLHLARQQISERLATVELPAGLPPPALGPIATGLGEVFHYLLSSPSRSLTELRTIQDWTIKPQLRSVPGVAEVNGWGGYERQYQVVVDPSRLLKHGLTLADVVGALQRNNSSVGGGAISRGGELLLVQGMGLVTTLEEVGSIVITAHEGVPIFVRDVGEVAEGHEIRRGAVTAEGEGEAVLGLAFTIMDENAREVTRRLRARVEEIRPTLPPDVELTIVYDRTELVDHVLATVRRNLMEGALLVVAVLFIFMGNLRAGLIVALAIPLSMLFAGNLMLQAGIAGSLMSLGAIDFGLIVDSSVISVENSMRHLRGSGSATVGERTSGGAAETSSPSHRTRLEIVRDAAIEVRRPTMFGELIIMIVYLPILTLEGIEGKLFRPMALTVVFALAGSLILSLTLMPVLASLLLPHGPPKPNLASRLWKAVWHRFPTGAVWHRRPAGAPVTPAATGGGRYYDLSAAAGGDRYSGDPATGASLPELGEPLAVRVARRIYAPMLRAVIRVRWAVLAVAAMVLTAGAVAAPRLGAVFIPRLSEEAIVINTVRLAGVSLEESVRYGNHIEQLLLGEFPDEIRHVWSRTGTAEVATDPMGIELTDIFVSLTPRDRWKRARTQDELVRRMEEALEGMPAMRAIFTQPIEMRINEMVAGIRSDLGVKVFGDDFEQLQAAARQIEDVLRTIAGSADTVTEQLTGQPVLEVRLRTDQLARHGVPAAEVLEYVAAVGNLPVGDIRQGEVRFPLTVRLADGYREDPQLLARLLIPTAGGALLPLADLADLRIVEGPSTIQREWGKRRIVVQSNVRGRDLGSFVAEARRRIAQEVPLPAGYYVRFGGQFEHLERGSRRLMLVVPLALGLVCLLLYTTYQRLADVVRIFLTLPIAAAGGIFALHLRDLPFSISAGVGFVAMCGVSVLGDMVFVSYLRGLLEKGIPLRQAIEQAAMTRLRPVLMTGLVASLGFVPMAINTGVGAEVQRPLATVVIGCVVTSMLLTLLVLPVLYSFASGRRRGTQEPALEPAAATMSGPAADAGG